VKLIIDLARRVTVVIDDSLPQTARDITLKANMISGGKKRVSIELPLGEPERPIPPQLLRDKFLHLSGPVLGKRNSEKLYNTLMTIDEMDDLETLYSALVP